MTVENKSRPKRIDSDEALVNGILEMHPDYRDKHGISKKIMKEILGTLMRVITRKLIAGEDVVLPGIGKIVVVDSGSTNYYNPHTQKLETRSPKKRLAFRVSSIIRRKI